MGNLTPLSTNPNERPVFTTAGLLLSEGAKITRDVLNTIANNTAFNWLGGRHPMRESSGVVTVTLSVDADITDDEIDDLDNLGVPYSVPDSTTGLVPAVDAEVIIGTRLQGIRQFSTKDTYQVFLTLITSVQYDYRINTGNANFDSLLSIDRNFFNLYSLSVVSQEPDRFTIRFDMRQPYIIGGGLQNYQIAWFAKGW